MSSIDNSPIKVYIVAGPASVGKSTAICNISGLTPNPNRKNPEVEGISTLQIKNNISIDIFCKSKSLQEAGIEPLKVEEYIYKKTKRRTFSAILIALRTDVIYKKPPAKDYIDVFANTFKWQIEKVVELGTLQIYCQQNQYQYQSFAYVSKNAMNQRDYDVKKFFGFLDE